MDDVLRVQWTDGAEATYRVIGHGPTAMLGVPGGPGLPATYVTDFTDGTTDLFRWYLVDPPGTGGTPPAGGYTVDDHVVFYRGVATALGLDRFVVWGHSFGGIVATRLAAQDARVLGVVLVGTPVLGVQPDVAEGGGIRTAMMARVQRHASEPWYGVAYGMTFGGEMPDDPADGMRQVLKLSFASPTDVFVDRLLAFVPGGINEEAMATFYSHDWEHLDLRPDLARITRPLLSIVGEHDWESPPEQAQLHGAHAPRATVVVIPDCGHYVELEQPGAWRDAVRRWATSEVLVTG